MKQCAKCKELKPLENFTKDRQQKSGLKPYCKTCRREEQIEYRRKPGVVERQKETAHVWRRSKGVNPIPTPNPEKCKETKQAWRKANREKLNKATRKYNYIRSAWKKKNPGLVRSYSAKRRATELNATPKWLTQAQLLEMQEIYTSCHTMSVFHEEKYHVDH